MPQQHQETEGRGVSRRGFLLAAGAAVAGPLAVAAAAELQSDRKVRVGVVGGGFGAAFQWHLDPNCTVEAVSDLKEGRRKHLQRVYKCDKAYESLEKLVLDPKIDAVAVFTEAPNHVRHVVEVMKHGKHAMSAVPAAVTIEECYQLKEITERTGLSYMMAETSYYRAPCMLARQLWADGKFGDFLYSEVEYYHPSIGSANDGLSVRKGKRTWRYGYPPMLYPTHSTCFHVGVTRERLTKVSCLGWGDDEPALKDNVYNNPFASQSALFRTSGGNICRCNVFWRGHAHGERAQWIGEELSMFMRGWAGQPFVVRPRKGKAITAAPNYMHLLPKPMHVRSGHGNSHAFLTHEFIAALVEERTPAVDVYESIAMTAPGIVAMASSRKDGEQMAVPSFDKA